LIANLGHRNLEDPLQEKAASDLNLAVNAMKNWKSDRETTASRKGGTFIQATLSHIGNFLKFFSGIAEIVKAAANNLVV
jgi:hypothetical protein